MTWEIDLSIGPVQGFVAQSRRTRDLWGSSYLLSYLAAHAMRGAVTAGGTIVRPRVDDDPLFRWVCGDRSAPPPRIGSVPNHFVVRSDTDAGAVAAAATAAFQDAWRQVCQAVWRYYLQHVCHLGAETEQIWRRQVEGFWEIVWVAAESGNTGGLLARRKHWRTHRLPDEPGDKCTVMSDFQELSGHVRAARGSEAQKRFWDEVRARVGVLELKEEERLCALAFVKRFFPKIGRETIGGALDVDHWPSTMYVGAAPWLREVRDRAAAEAKEYVEALNVVAFKETIRSHVPLAEFDGAEPGKFFRLDANYYHHGFLTSERRAPLKGGDDSTRDRLGELLRRVYQSTGSPPPVYYAFLLADGDRLGEQVAKTGGDVGKVSEALSAFGGRVGDIVRRHQGVTVYAGGDDALAMLPVPEALDCADRLAEAYTEAFTGQGLPTATLSAAVVFAHVRMPVGRALAHARDLLENVAKEGNNRDSLVVAVLKPGGTHCQWVTTWTRRYPDGRKERAVKRLNGLVEMMRDKDGGRGFSASLLHHTHETLTLLCGQPDWSPGRVGELPAGLDLAAYIRAEVLDSRESSGRARSEGSPAHGGGADGEPAGTDIERVTELVVDLLPPSVNPAEENTTTVDAGRVGIDGLLLARFIADGGREEDHG